MRKTLAFLVLLLTLVLTSKSAPIDTALLKVQAFNVDSATEQWLSTLNGAAREKSDAYFEGGYWLLLWEHLYAVVVALLFMATGLSARIKKMLGAL